MSLTAKRRKWLRWRWILSSVNHVSKLHKGINSCVLRLGFLWIGSCVSSVIVIQPSSNYSSHAPVSDRLSSMRRGTGGRSSFNGIVATVFGASGFLGKIVCNKLGKVGTQVIVPYRGEYYDVHPLKMVGDLGQVMYTHYNLKDEDSLRKAMHHSNLVINLIGRDWETRNFSFDDIYAKGSKQQDFHIEL